MIRHRTMGRVIAFPLVATIAGCQGITQDDPRVRECKGVDTVTYKAPSDSNITIRVITTDSTGCRKPAA